MDENTKIEMECLDKAVNLKENAANIVLNAFNEGYQLGRRQALLQYGGNYEN